MDIRTENAETATPEAIASSFRFRKTVRTVEHAWISAEGSPSTVSSFSFRKLNRRGETESTCFSPAK